MNPQKNRERAIFVDSQFIAVLNQGKKISKEKINKIVGGKGFGSECGPNTYV